MSSNVFVNWDHSGLPDTVSGYNIYYGPSNHYYTNFVTVGYVTNVVISNIPTPAYFSGKTIAPDGSESAFGNEIRSTPIPANTLPSMVRDFSISKVAVTIY